MRRGADRRRAAVALLLALGGAAAVPAQERVFDERGLSEKALVDALAPRAPASRAAPAADAGLGATRGFKPVVPGAAPPPAEAPRRASILVTFRVDSAELTPRAKSALDVVGRAMRSPQLAGVTFTVEGHADPRGGETHNQALSGARAASVADYLVAAHGIAAARLAPVGLGSSRLLNPREPTAPENRRVTLVAR
jgi:OOP family OmpA-OmpF porin